MPKVNYTGRKVILKVPRKKYHKKKKMIGRIGRQIGYNKPLVLPIRQSFSEDFLFTAPPAPWTSDTTGIYKSQAWNLNALGATRVNQLKDMFAQYKIVAVKEDYYFGVTSSTANVTATGDPPAADIRVSNVQMMLYSAKTESGRAVTASEEYFLTRQNAKRRLCISNSRRAVSLYNKTKQLSFVYNTALNTDYAITYPKYISTDEPTTAHYGSHVRIHSLNDTTKEPVRIKVITTYYMLFRQLKGQI